MRARVSIIIVAVAAAVTSSVVGCARGPAGASAASGDAFAHTDALEGEEQSCSRDVECVLVEDCCGCARGGLRTSVRTDKLEAVTERSEAVCAERVCGEQTSQHRSCTATAARCLGGRCVPAL